MGRKKGKRGRLGKPYVVVDKRIRFLNPYIRAVEDLLPVGKEIHIKGKFIDRGYLGLTRAYDDKVVVTIVIGELVFEKAGEDSVYPIGVRSMWLCYILESLAHELAHVIAGADAGHTAEWARAYGELMIRLSEHWPFVSEIQVPISGFV